MELILKETEVTKLNLQQGEVLVVKVKVQEMGQDSLEEFGTKLRNIFPNNKVVVLGLGPDDDVKFETIAGSEADLSCVSSPVGYCSNCDCGKREQIEGK